MRRVVDLDVEAQLALRLDDQVEDVEHVAQVDHRGRVQHQRGVRALQDVVRGDHLAARVLEEDPAQLPQHRLEAQAHRRRQARAGHPGARHEAQVDLVGARVGRVARVAHAGGALLEVDAGQLDLAA